MNKIMILGPAIMAMAFAANVNAQATDVWLARIEHGVPVNPVKINPETGYNNQPHFSADGSTIYYTRELGNGADAQTDIAAFEVATSTTTMLTHTSESEYSPTPVPAANALSVIQVEPDQKQRLWAINLPDGEMHVLFPDVEPVGYHVWINDREAAMFILGDSFTLQTASLDKEGSRLVADNIGRSLHKHPVSNEVLFVDKNFEPWQVAAFNPEAKTLTSLISLYPGNEDFTVDADGNFWTGNGSKLYKHAFGGRRWELVADLKIFGITQISRLAIHLESGQIALVNEPPAVN